MMVLGTILVVTFCISLTAAIACALVLQIYLVCLSLDLACTGRGNSDNVYGHVADFIEKHIINHVR